MAVVRGDRIGESRKLSACTPEEQDAYARLVSTVPDDFGRFRISLPQIVAAMYPRMDDPRRIGRAAGRWRRFIAAFEVAGLVRTWQADAVVFGEFLSWCKRKNPIWHRTPEPPWGGHQHTGWCLPTAIARSREYAPGPETEALTLQLRDLKVRRARGEGGLDRRYPFYPSPPSPPSPPTEERTTEHAPPDGGRAPLAQVPTSSPSEADDMAALDAICGPSTTPPVPRETWPTQEALEDWTARYSAGSVPRARVLSALKRLVAAQAKRLGRSQRDTWTDVGRPAWQRYLRETTHPSPSAQDFVAHFGDWLPVATNGNGTATHAPPPDPPSRPEAQLAWRRVLVAAEAVVPRQAFATWFRPTDGWSLEGGVLTVLAPAAITVEGLEGNYRARVAEAMAAVGLPCEVRFIAHAEGS